MPRLQMRTKFFLYRLLIGAVLTVTATIVARQSVQEHVQKEIVGSLLNSTTTFQNFQREHELSLMHSAELLANLPSLKALMTTQHAATIQDASTDLWHLGGSDLFLLADRTGKVVALHATTPLFSRAHAQELLQNSLHQEDSRHWWVDGEHLYEVILQPVFFGSPSDNNPLGVLAVGHETDERTAQEISRIASGDVAFSWGNTIPVSTLQPVQKAELARQIHNALSHDLGDVREVRLNGERYLLTSVELAHDDGSPAVMYVLKSYDRAIEFLDSLTRLIIWLGLGAVLVATAAVLLIADTFTRPLSNLVKAVRALERGDFGYPLEVRQGDELAEVTAAFDEMRQNLQKTQQRLLEAEQFATIGRMASSISHDLRHPLTAIMANAEFLSEDNLNQSQRGELYKEVRLAVERMTDLIESLLEFSRTRESLHLVRGNVEEAIERAVQMARARPEFEGIAISVGCDGGRECWFEFDSKKLQRVFDNLLVNACEAVSRNAGRIEVMLRERPKGLDIRFEDNGPGVPESIRDRLFMPFVSFGKERGTGLGLAVAQKIMQEHGGSIVLESSAPGSTVFKLFLPRMASPEEARRTDVVRQTYGD
jgi:signal transduction histidine kinase